MAKRKQTESKRTAKKLVTERLSFDFFTDVAERCRRAVVLIEVRRPRQRRMPFFGPFEIFPEPNNEVTNVGTGFVCDKRGYILTNQHVVQGSPEVQISFYGQKKPTVARVVKSDTELDLALLKTSLPANTPVLRFARPDQVRLGEWVMAIGNPLGLEHSVTVGVVSAINRPLTIGDRKYDKLIQTDAAINRGNSGGPLLNVNGEVIGINTAVSQSSQGIGFAIGADSVRKVLQKWLPPDRE